MADLLERCLQQAVEVDPQQHNAQDVRRIVDPRWWRGTADPANQDTAELIDAADRRTRIIDGRRNGTQRDVNDLNYAELNVLLQRARWPNVNRTPKF